MCGVDRLYRSAQEITAIGTLEIAAAERYIKPEVQHALLWMGTQLKDQAELLNPHHFGRVVTVSKHVIRFASALDGAIELLPIVSNDKLLWAEGWVRTIKLGAELVGAEDFPSCPVGDLTDVLYLKLLSIPPQSQEEAQTASGLFVPIPASELYNPLQLVN